MLPEPRKMAAKMSSLYRKLINYTKTKAGGKEGGVGGEFAKSSPPSGIVGRWIRGSPRATWEGGDRLVPKTEETKPKKALDKPSATPWNFKLIFSCAQRKAQSVFVCVCVCTCVCACLSDELSGHREVHSYLDEWLAQSLLVDFQHNVPDLFIRQAERAQENCCRDEQRRESFLLFYKVRQSSSKTHLRDHHSSDKIASLTWHLEKLISFFAFPRRGCLKFGMMLVWPLTFTFTTISKRKKKVKIKDVRHLKRTSPHFLDLLFLCFWCNNGN